jgi:uracil-DNA glycosylase
MLEPHWQLALGDELAKPYMQALRNFLKQRQAARAMIYPKMGEIFRAFTLTPLPQVKVIILGQDPYHGPGQAEGLCFSVPGQVRSPPSLLNIFKELQSDLGIPMAKQGSLEAWARQGVLLLNSVLTVEAGKAGAHQGQGWEQWTDRVIQILNEQYEHKVFLLWGAYAHRKGQWIDPKRHCVLKAAHPSPLSAYKGFLGCRHFSKANAYLSATGQTPIQWDLSSI